MNDLVLALGRGSLRAGELRARLGVSAATMMRAVRAAGASVVRIGRGRATRYATRQEWPHLGDTRFPLVRIAEDGAPSPAGELITLAARESVWMPTGAMSTGLPVALTDARPSGFLGRHFALQHEDLRLPPRLSDWSDHHILLAMSRRGEDLPGNLLVGDESFARWQGLTVTTTSRDAYTALADATMAGHPPGSSAGGERPKFGVFVDGRHVLVKFAARGSVADRAARRWCDLVVLEGLALDIVGAAGLTTARTTVIDTPSHCFLESERFDRVGARGRRAVLSLAAAHDDPRDSWARAATSLRLAGRVTGDDARRLRWLDAFGALIGNTDRHHYNVLFFTAGDTLRLAPAFDQVSMLYAPTPDGQVLPREFPVPAVTSDTLDVWDDARAAARQFWARCSADSRLSGDMRGICARNAVVIGG